MNKNPVLNLVLMLSCFAVVSPEALADQTIWGTQTRGTGASGQLKCAGVTIQKSGKITKVSDSGAGFWLQSDKGRYLRFDKASDGVGTVLEPSVWYVYPNLPQGANQAGVSLTVATGGGEITDKQSGALTPVKPSNAGVPVKQSNAATSIKKNTAAAQPQPESSRHPEHSGMPGNPEQQASGGALEQPAGGENSEQKNGRASDAPQNSARKQAAECRRRGNEHFKAGRYQDALPEFDKAVQLDPSNFNSYYNRANTRAKLGQYEESVADFNEAVRIASAPGFQKQTGSSSGEAIAKAAARRGFARFKLGRSAEAVKDYELALHYDPANETAKNLLADLKKSGKTGKGGVAAETPSDRLTATAERNSVVGRWTQHTASKGEEHTTPVTFKPNGFFDKGEQANAGHWTRKGREIKLQGRNKGGGICELTLILSADGKTLSNPTDSKLRMTRD
jgi:tetratricopeptide (TPR) repeat protein